MSQNKARQEGKGFEALAPLVNVTINLQALVRNVTKGLPVADFKRIKELEDSANTLYAEADGKMQSYQDRLSVAQSARDKADNRMGEVSAKAERNSKKNYEDAQRTAEWLDAKALSLFLKGNCDDLLAALWAQTKVDVWHAMKEEIKEAQDALKAAEKELAAVKKTKPSKEVSDLRALAKKARDEADDLKAVLKGLNGGDVPGDAKSE